MESAENPSHPETVFRDGCIVHFTSRRPEDEERDAALSIGIINLSRDYLVYASSTGALPLH